VDLPEHGLPATIMLFSVTSLFGKKVAASRDRFIIISPCASCLRLSHKSATADSQTGFPLRSQNKRENSATIRLGQLTKRQVQAMKQRKFAFIGGLKSVFQCFVVFYLRESRAEKRRQAGKF